MSDEALLSALLEEYGAVHSEKERIEAKWKALREQILRTMLENGVTQAPAGTYQVRAEQSARTFVDDAPHLLAEIAQRGLLVELTKVQLTPLKKAMAKDEGFAEAVHAFLGEEETWMLRTTTPKAPK